MTITGAIKGTSHLKICNEPGFESLKFGRWFRQLCVFYKIKTAIIPKYLHKLFFAESHTYNTRTIENIEWISIVELIYLNTLSFPM